MCGIAGAWLPKPSLSHAELIALGTRMTEPIQHRGPDADGHWASAAEGLVLGHRRLSIIDLSPAGAQPMCSATGRFVLVFNGEIYNFADLREELHKAGARFRGNSDTEVLLAGFEAWGIAKTIRRAAGMFALAVWDTHELSLSFARDRLGEKPLYVGWGNEGVVFGSELKALRAGPARSWQISHPAVWAFLRHGYVPAPLSIWDGVMKVRPGELLTIEAATSGPRKDRYWDAAQVLAEARRRPLRGTDTEILDELDALLRRVVRQEMVADVPLGAFLSGGVDSSLITALMQAETGQRVRSFTVGFSDERYNEAPFARAIASHLGTDHTEVVLEPTDALSFVDRLPQIYCEPFADSSQLPTLLVAHVTRRHVTVALSGDGGDEVFSGYSQYRPGRDSLEGVVSRVPPMFRHPLAFALSRLPKRARLNLIGLRSGSGEPLESVDVRFLAALRGATEQESYVNALAVWPDPSRLLRYSAVHSEASIIPWLSEGDFSERRMLHDTLSYLPDDICVKVDRAAMDASLEVRAPLLHHEVVEFAWGIPIEKKRRGDEGKLLLKALLTRYVPSELFTRPKRGFGVPLGAWLRGPLAEWAESLVNDVPEPLQIRQDALQQLLQRHLNGEVDASRQLWPVLTLVQWYRETVRA